MANYFKTILLFFIALLWSSCQKVIYTANFSNILLSESDVVIIPTYETLNNNAKVLVQRLQDFKLHQDSTRLQIAKDAWKNTKKPWENSQAFVFGPVENQGYNKAMNSWPIDISGIKQIIQGTNEISKEYLDIQDGFLKGFHAIEYLLYDSTGNKSASQFTKREIDYMIAAAMSLQGSTQNLFNFWNKDGNDFGANLRNAGIGGIYNTQKTALTELTGGMSFLIAELTNIKIEKPYKNKNTEFEASRFSNNSKDDFINNLKSIQNVYLGSTNGIDGAGISALIAQYNPTLDIRVKDEIKVAIQSIENIPRSYNNAIFMNGPSIDDAIQKCLILQQSIDKDVLPIIRALP